jgi:hypothetical protein
MGVCVFSVDLSGLRLVYSWNSLGTVSYLVDFFKMNYFFTEVAGFFVRYYAVVFMMVVLRAEEEIEALTYDPN